MIMNEAKVVGNPISDYVLLGQSVLEAEAKALLGVAKYLNNSLNRAIDIILNHKGKVVVSGIGKSGHVAQKIASTFCSTGTPAVFLHPGDAMHGDLGIYSPGDPTIFVSKSGTTVELVRLIPILKGFDSPIIAILSNVNSPLSENADVVLNATVPTEADPLKIVPTSSTLAAMGIGDVLASCLMNAKSFKEDDFMRFHPGGQLGRNLGHMVKDVMHKTSKIAVLDLNATLLEAVIAMTKAPYGATCIAEKGQLEGIITEGDIRRQLLNNKDFSKILAKDVMTRNPTCIGPNASLGEAVRLMEDRPSQISVLPVIGGNGELLGLVRIHDIYQPQLG